MGGKLRWIFIGLVSLLSVLGLAFLMLSRGNEVEFSETPPEAPNVEVAEVLPKKPDPPDEVPAPDESALPDLHSRTPVPSLRQPFGGATHFSFTTDGKPANTEGNCSVSGVVVDPNGAPLAEMQVISGGFSTFQFPRTVTDAKGRFHAERLLPRVFKLMAIPPTTTGENIDTGKVEINLEEGQQLTDIRIVYEGASERSIAGRITDAAGKPVAGTAIQGADHSRGLHATTESGADGTYVLDLSLNAYCQVSAAHPDFSVQAAKSVRAGDHDVDFVLLRRGAIEGRAVDARTGEPITKFAAGARPREDRFARPGYVHVENDEGLFRLDQVSSGELNLYVRAEGYAPCRVEGVLVRPDEVTGGVIARLNRGASVHGTVVAMDGTPVAGAKFRLENPDDWAMLPPVEDIGGDTIAVRSRADGRFFIDHIDPGFREITAVHADFPETKARIRLAPGKTTTLKIIMTGLAVVEGTVYLNGQPVAEQRVTAGTDTMKVPREGETDENGFYRIRDVPEGEVTVRTHVNAADTAGRNAEARVTTRLGYTTAVDLGVFSGTATVEGTVSQGRDPLEFISISASEIGGDDQASTMTSTGGAYRIAGLFGGTYRVVVIDTRRGPPELLASAEATVDAGESTVLDIDVSPPGD